MKSLHVLVCILLAIGCAAQSSAQPGDQAKPCSMAKVFNEIPSMPYEQFYVTVYNLRRDEARWKKTLDQIDPSTLSEKFLLDKGIRERLSDVKAALSDMDKSTAVIIHCPNVAETLATTFDLMRLREDLLSIE